MYGTIEVLPNPHPIAGCTYGNAANYVVYANVDDGSCVFAVCTEEDADNYQPLATVDDGTCVFGECEALCPADINGDGAVNTNDLLGLLGYLWRMKQGLPANSISTSMINQIFQVFDGLKALNVFLLGVATVNLVNGQLLYEENFDSYNDGDAITQVSAGF